MLKQSEYHLEHVAVFSPFVLTEKSIENASVRFSFCHTPDNTVNSLSLNIAVTVATHVQATMTNKSKHRKKTSDSLLLKPC